MRHLSKKAKKAISDAQKERWAKWHQKKRQMAENPNQQSTIIDQDIARTAAHQFQHENEELKRYIKDKDILVDTLEKINHDYKEIMINNGHIINIILNALSLRKTLAS